MLKPRLNLPPTPQPDESCDSPADQAEEIAYEMAYGLSHELNNPLANIAGRARLLAEQEPDPEKRQQLAVIVDQAMRGCEMIADLMLFARPPKWELQTVDLRSVLMEVHARTQRAACSQSSLRQLSIVLDIEATLASATIKADHQAIVEAIWAVGRNALEAAHSSVRMQLSRRAEWLTITITDDGPGLSEKALSHAFHPYFSGREAGRGLGLGLSKTQRILSLCAGNITISNIAPTGC